MTETTTAPEKKQEQHEFKAEVSRLLHMMVHSVYSEQEVFLRELISNASDACDRLRYAALTAPELLGDDKDFRITIHADPDARTLTITDNGIGMNREDMIENLGTIARSGTNAFLAELTGDAKKDLNLIGQFGVGFYSVFMVATRVEVISRKAGEDKAWRWESDGLGAFKISEAERDSRGTEIRIYLKDEAREFVEVQRLKAVVKKYSDHIPVTISLAVKGKDEETVNTGQALWMRPRSDITKEQYKEFYRHTAHAFDEPWATLHYRAEGVIEYSVLLYIPTQRPFDLFDPARKPRVKLYVKRVFITDDCEDVLPGYLRFVRGVIDSEDLPLNISREMLQHNPVLAKIRKAVTNKVLAELERKSKDAESYARFWDSFGAVLKEGIYEDGERRDKLLKLARFHSTSGDGLTSLDDYVKRMKPDQKAIYYITGDDLASVRRSPQLEGFRARGVEVLLLTDPVDDFWLSMVPEYDGKPFKSVTRGGSELKDLKTGKDDEKDPEKSEVTPGIEALVAAFKEALGDAVKDVRTTDRLTNSAVCLVADEGDMDIHMERILKAHHKLGHTSPRILEINPGHPVIKTLAATVQADAKSETVREAAELLLDQARIVEGEPLPDPAGFAARLSAAIARGFGGG